MANTVIMPLLGTFRPQGGMTKSALRKAYDLTESGKNVFLVSFSFRLDQEDHEDELRKAGQVHPDCHFVNFYSSVAQEVDTNTPQYRLPRVDQYIIQRENKRLTRFFNPDGSLGFSQLLNRSGKNGEMERRYWTQERRLRKVEQYNGGRFPARIRYYDERGESVVSDTWLSKSGHLFMNIWYKNNDVDRVFVFTKRTIGFNQSYSSLESVMASWFVNWKKAFLRPTILLDSPQVAPIVLPALGDNLSNILTIHSNTFSVNGDPKSSVNSEHRMLLDQAHLFSKIVVSTEQQAADLRSVFPNSRFSVIPQALPKTSHPSDMTRQPKRIVYLGRLTKSKQIDQVVQRFQKLLEQFPEVHLDIYGTGPEEANIKKIIEEKSLSAVVHLMGNSSNPLEVFSSSYCSIMPSRTEGFGMTIAESMLARCPVVAFDCKYGPSDLIADEETGLLVPENDFEQFMRSIVWMLQNPEQVDKMRNAAAKFVSRFCDPLRVASLWTKLVDELSTSEDPSQTVAIPPSSMSQ